MQALFYLQKTMFLNRLKKALKKPVTYIYIVGGGAYLALILFSFGPMFEGMGLAHERGLVGSLTALIFFLMPSNIISYTKRKGLIYTASDVHFVFPSPFGPKTVLMYAQMRAILLTFALGLVLSIGGSLWFHVSPLKMFLYFIFASVIENILEASLVILLYGNETISKEKMKIFPILMYLCMAIFVLLGFLLIRDKGLSMESILNYLFLPGIQLVPIIGWNIAVLHLLFIGPSLVSVIGASLYLLSTVVLFIMAKKIKCTGQYYEDAIKFADDYAEARAKGKKGEVAFVGKKKKFGKATIAYKGSYAKAIFYRQLLEYKKNRFFLFGMNSLIMFGVGIGIVVVTKMERISSNVEYIIPGIMAYIALVFSGYATKWQKELASPYTYLLPDTSFRKLWYATLTEHIRSVADACLITIPGAIALKLTLVQAILTILIYICLQANKLYLTVLVEGLLRNLLGEFGKQMLRILLYGGVVGMGALAAVVGTVVISAEAGFSLLIIVLIVLTLGCMFAASSIFDKMEAME